MCRCIPSLVSMSFMLFLLLCLTSLKLHIYFILIFNYSFGIFDYLFISSTSYVSLLVSHRLVTSFTQKFNSCFLSSTFYFHNHLLSIKLIWFIKIIIMLFVGFLQLQFWSLGIILFWNKPHVLFWSTLPQVHPIILHNISTPQTLHIHSNNFHCFRIITQI